MSKPYYHSTLAEVYRRFGIAYLFQLGLMLVRSTTVQVVTFQNMLLCSCIIYWCKQRQWNGLKV
jgi:hypothetical protein